MPSLLQIDDFNHDGFPCEISLIEDYMNLHWCNFMLKIS